MTRFTLTVAAATAAGSLVLGSAAFAATPAPAANSSGSQNASMMQGNVDTTGIHNFLANLTNDALTKDDLSKLVADFCPADAARIEKSSSYSESDGKKLDGRIEQINQAWKSKYGHDFDIRNANNVYGSNFAVIQQCTETSNPQLARAIYSINSPNMIEMSSVTVESGQVGNAAQNSQKTNEKANEKTTTRELALVTLSGHGSHPDVNIPLMREKNGDWRLNVSNKLDAATIRQNLLNHLTRIGQNSSKWPANEDQAYEAVTRAVLTALVPPGSQQANQQGSSAQPDAHATKS